LIKTGILFLFIATLSHASLAEWHNTVSANSDYVFRGLRYPGPSAALSLSSEYQFKNGWRGGLWLSEHGEGDSFHGQRELDYWLGYARSITDKTTAELSIIRYTFPESWLNDYDWQELVLSFHIDQRWSVSLGTNRNQFGGEESGKVLELTHRRLLDGALFKNTLLDITIGNLKNRDIADDFIYYELGISRDFNRWRPRLAWVSTRGGPPTVYQQSLARGEWSFSLSYSF
jgi:uncharacterized protein (TIGR02001 family)